MSVYRHVEPSEAERRRSAWVAAGFVVLALVTHVLPPAAQGRVSGAIRATVLAPFLGVHERFVRARSQATEAGILRTRLDSLTSVVLNRQALTEENARLRALLGLQARTGRDLEAVTLVRSGTAGSESVFLLNKGFEDGVAVGAAVMVAGGLVGQVREASERRAIGIDWSHPDFRAGAMTEDGAVYGIVEPVPGGFREDDRLLFNGAPYSSDIASGTPIVASGRGGVYPRGLPIGVIDTVAQQDDGWRKAYWVVPAVTPASVTHALVNRWTEEERRAGVPSDWWLAPDLPLDNPFDAAIARELPTVADTPSQQPDSIP